MELVARVKSLFRRLNLDKAENSSDIIQFGNIEININTRSATVDEQPFDLTPTEFSLMIYLMKNNTKAISREELLKNVWKFDFDVDTRATDDVIKRLRKKLLAVGADVKIESVWGFGFKIGIGGINGNN
jgi:DNA-binding response OmpR family regulator